MNQGKVYTKKQYHRHSEQIILEIRLVFRRRRLKLKRFFQTGLFLCLFMIFGCSDKTPEQTSQTIKPTRIVNEVCDSIEISKEGVAHCEIKEISKKPLKLKFSGQKNFSQEEIKEQKISSTTEIDLSDNPDIEWIPSFVYTLSDLKKIDISNTKISDWDQRICQLKNLEVFIGRGNSYKDNEIPFHTFCLENLKVLDFSNSSIRYVDEYIGKLTELQELYMSNNDIFTAPYMLVSLKNLILVDLNNNNRLMDQKLNTVQSCKNEKDADDLKECSEELAESFLCEFSRPIPFQRKTPFRTLYIDFIDSNKKIDEVCDDEESRVCPHFVKSCKHIEDSEDRRACMLNYFEDIKTIHPDLWLNRSICYHSWGRWYNDFDEFPERLEHTIAGRTIRELRFRSEYYMREDKWDNLLCPYVFIPFQGTAGWDRMNTQAFEVAPEKTRKVEFSKKVTLGIRNGFIDWWLYDEQTKQSKYKEFLNNEAHCPYLPELGNYIEKRWREEYGI